MEIVVAILIFTLFYALFFNLNETIEILYWLWIPILVGCAVTYFLGWLIGRCFPIGFRYRRWHGVLIMFTLLIAGIIAAMLMLSVSVNSDIDAFSDVFPVLFIFLIFGGIPTLFVGLWLGNRLIET